MGRVKIACSCVYFAMVLFCRDGFPALLERSPEIATGAAQSHRVAYRASCRVTPRELLRKGRQGRWRAVGLDVSRAVTGRARATRGRHPAMTSLAGARAVSFGSRSRRVLSRDADADAEFNFLGRRNIPARAAWWWWQLRAIHGDIAARGVPAIYPRHRRLLDPATPRRDACALHKSHPRPGFAAPERANIRDVRLLHVSCLAAAVGLPRRSQQDGTARDPDIAVLPASLGRDWDPARQIPVLGDGRLQLGISLTNPGSYGRLGMGPARKLPTHR